MQSSFSVFANYPATKPCLILSKANQSHLNSLSVKLSHMYKNALTWMSTSLSDLFPCSVHVPIRSLKVNCTLHRCHKERKFRSRRTVRSVCACAFFLEWIDTSFSFLLRAISDFLVQHEERRQLQTKYSRQRERSDVVGTGVLLF